MTASELATFLKEEVPRIKKHAAEFPYKDALRSDEADLLSALAAAVVLLREAADLLVPYDINSAHDAIIMEYLATFRLVVGEKDTG